MQILLGVTGSVAATLTPKLVEALRAAGHEVQVVATESSLYFWNPRELSSPSTSPSQREGEKKGKAFLPLHRSGGGAGGGGVRVWRDSDEWPGERYTRDQPILHIELRRWADVLVIAPLSANTLAKLSVGMCDTLLTSIVRAWDVRKPIVLAPAMNTHMWEHPATQEHLATLQRWLPKLLIIEPQVKTLACGDTGIGAMADVERIASLVSALQASALGAPAATSDERHARMRERAEEIEASDDD